MTSIKYRTSVDKDVVAIDRVLPDSMTPQGIKVSFHRTIRVPDNGSISQLPPGLGSFPLHKVRDHASRLPAAIVRKGGVFFPMHQKEAMWVSLQATAPFMVKMYAGGVNVVSGEHSEEDGTTTQRRSALKTQGRSIQDYVVVPEQPWIDGIAVKPGAVRQFVAMPIGDGYTVEAQIAGVEDVRGLQFEITPSHCVPQKTLTPPSRPRGYAVPKFKGNLQIFVKTETGKTITLVCHPRYTIGNVKAMIQDKRCVPLDKQRLIYSGRHLMNHRRLADYHITNYATLHLILSLLGGCPPTLARHELGIAPGGLIDQQIREDKHNPIKWIKDVKFTIPVHILSSATFRRATGTEPPACPIDAGAYAGAGLPFFHLHEEQRSSVSGAGALASTRSVSEVGVARGLAAGKEVTVYPRLVGLPRGDGHVSTVVYCDGNVFRIDDEDGLLSPEWPRRQGRTLTELEKEVACRAR